MSNIRWINYGSKLIKNVRMEAHVSCCRCKECHRVITRMGEKPKPEWICLATDEIENEDGTYDHVQCYSKEWYEDIEYHTQTYDPNFLAFWDAFKIKEKTA